MAPPSSDTKCWRSSQRSSSSGAVTLRREAWNGCEPPIPCTACHISRYSMQFHVRCCERWRNLPKWWPKVRGNDKPIAIYFFGGIILCMPHALSWLNTLTFLAAGDVANAIFQVQTELEVTNLKLYLKCICVQSPSDYLHLNIEWWIWVTRSEPTLTMWFSLFTTTIHRIFAKHL